MSKVTVSLWDEDPADVMIEFDPPLKAYMEVTNEAGDAVNILADIVSFSPLSGEFDFQYTDPDWDAMLVCDVCKAERLTFIATEE